jgi:hypothetical protein
VRILKELAQARLLRFAPVEWALLNIRDAKLGKNVKIKE